MGMNPESLKHSLRRHHVKRKKAWVRKTLRRYFLLDTDFSSREVGLYAPTPKVCSCFMCGNPRRHHGLPTLQERRSHLDTGNVEAQPDSSLPKPAQSHFG